MAWFPSQHRLEGVLEITQEQNLWIKGRLKADPNVYVEISFEHPEKKHCLPNTYVVYLGVWHGKKTYFEFQLGTLCVKPRQEHWQLIYPLIERLKNYRPLQVDPAFASRIAS